MAESSHSPMDPAGTAHELQGLRVVMSFFFFCLFSNREMAPGDGGHHHLISIILSMPLGHDADGTDPTAGGGCGTSR